jgi:hypothetical protein|tara:strand:+ start:141 stop:344 length:204 start_codon:yes stop_codon:yes gene_type:complete
MWDKIRLRINFWTYRLWNTFWVILIPVSVIWYGIKEEYSILGWVIAVGSLILYGGAIITLIMVIWDE